MTKDLVSCCLDRRLGFQDRGELKGSDEEEGTELEEHNLEGSREALEVEQRKKHCLSS